MTWPSSDIPTGNTDAPGDNPQIARGDILGLMQAFNLLRNHFSTFMRNLAEAADAPAARTALGASTVGSNVFTAADAATARSAMEAADAAATVNLTGAQTVAGLKTFSGGHLSTSTAQAVGYGVGAGGVVVQATSKSSTTPAINRPSGVIVTSNSTLNAGASAFFRVPNSLATASTVVFVNVVNSDRYIASVVYTGIANISHPAGFMVRLTNIDASPLSDAVGINFVVMNIAGS